MNKESLKDAIFLKEKESFIVGILLVFFVIILIVPVVIILFLRFIFKSIFRAKKRAQEEREVIASKISSDEKSILL